MSDFKVNLVGWSEGFEKIATTRLLRELEGYGLASAKQVVDDLLDERNTILPSVRAHDEAKQVVERYESLGVRCEIIST